MRISLTLLIATASLLTAINAYEPSWAHFATEHANKAASHYDLSVYGIPGGQLPKIYNLTGGSMIYQAEASFTVFQQIKTGLRKRSHIIDQALPVDKRDAFDARECNSINIDLFGPCGTYEYHNSCVGATCVSQAGCKWDEIVVYNIDDAFITFWSSSVCNGRKGSFNPRCRDDNPQTCQFNLHWESFRVFSGCHEQYQSNC